MIKIESVDDLWDFIGYVFLYAPNFPHRDYLPEDEQMTLENAFDLLGHGILISYPEADHQDKRQKLNQILEQSLQFYKGGADSEGRKLLRVFQEYIFKTD